MFHRIQCGTMRIEAVSNIVWNVYKGALHSTHVDTVSGFMGSQWVIYNASLQYSPLRPLVKVVIVHMGVQHDPLWLK